MQDVQFRCSNLLSRRHLTISQEGRGFGAEQPGKGGGKGVFSRSGTEILGMILKLYLLSKG